MTNSKRTLWLGVAFVGLVALTVAGRVMSETPNVAPVAAAALFAGFLFRHRLVAALVPLSAMLISDVFSEGMYQWALMLVVYGALAFPVLLRRVVGEKLSAWRVGGASLIGSGAFFLITNLAEWAMMGHYPRTLEGLAACFLAAVPFFKNTIAGDLAWNTGFFGSYALAVALWSRRVLAPGTQRATV